MRAHRKPASARGWTFPGAPWMPSLLRRVGSIALLALAACGPGTDASRGGTILFHDDFNAENGMVSSANYRHLAQWEVMSGSVDLAGSYPFELLPPGHGMYVDLDGATMHAGVVRTRRVLDLAPGTYELSFMLAGSQRVSDPNVVHVSLGSLLHATYRVPPFATPRWFRLRVVAAQTIHARIVFAHEGGDNFGALLDDVVLRRM